MSNPTTKRKAASEIHDSEELTREFRMATGPENRERRGELNARSKELRQQWRDEHPEEVAAQERHQRAQMEAELNKERVMGRMVQGDFEAMCVLTDLEHAALNEGKRAFEASERARRAEATADRAQARAERAEAGQTPRGVPFADTSLAQKPEGHKYTPEDFCEALKWPTSKADTIRRALRSWDKGKGTKQGSRWMLTRQQTEAFWARYRHERHEKPHPPRANTNQ